MKISQQKFEINYCKIYYYNNYLLVFLAPIYGILVMVVHHRLVNLNMLVFVEPDLEANIVDFLFYETLMLNHFHILDLLMLFKNKVQLIYIENYYCGFKILYTIYTYLDI